MPFAQLPIMPVPSAAACLAATGAPGEISRWTPTGLELMSVSSTGLHATGAVRLGRLVDCPAVAGQPNGSAVIAAASGKRLRIVLRAPRAGWGAPVTIRGAVPVQAPATAVSSHGDAVVAWVEYDETGRSRLRVVGRPRDGVFGSPSTIAGWARRPIPEFPAVGIADDGSALLAFTTTTGTNTERGRVMLASAPPGGAFGKPVRAGGTSTPLAPGLAVAPDGRALITLGNEVAERPPGGVFDIRTRVPGALLFEPPSIALRDDGAAAIVWSQGEHELDVIARPTAGPFGGLLAAGGTTTDGGEFVGGESSIAVSLTERGRRAADRRARRAGRDALRRRQGTAGRTGERRRTAGDGDGFRHL